MYRKLFLMLLVMFCLTVSTVLGQSREEDSLALVDLYNSTDGDNWDDNTNWLSGPINTWYGVTVSGGRVTQLDLTGNGLDGTIPASIGDLTELVVLRLCYNNLYGLIPSSIGNLTNLTTLYIRGRSVGSTLGGSIPSEIGNLTNLQYFNLTNNHLSGPIPSSIGNLTNLISLDLSSNENLSGSIPSSIGNLTDLTVLNLRYNNLSGSIPSGIGNLTSLTYLNLFYNNLSGSIPSGIGNLTNLQYLYLNDNSLSGSIPSSIGDLSNLVELSIGDNQLTGSIPTSIGDLSQLEELSFTNNQFTGSVPSSIGNLSRLRSMHILGNNLEDLPGLSGLTSLRHLEIQNNKFTFEDIEPNVNVPSSSFNYSPQAKVGEVQNEIITEGSDFTISVSVGGEHNEYQWKKDGSVISGATNDSYTITSAEMSDAGSYTCEITNTVAIYLILYSNPINITVNPAPPAVVVTSPNGGEDWQAISSHDITWTSVGTSGSVQIEYSLDNGSSWSEVISSIPDTGIYSWMLPDTTSDSCLVRITDTIGSPSDISDAVFAISPGPSIIVTSPNGGENWLTDSTYDIIWTSYKTSGGVKIEYSLNNGTDWTEIISSIPDEGSYPWTVPDTVSDSCLINISDTNSIWYDTSDSIFSISPFAGIEKSKLPEFYSLDVKEISIGDQVTFSYAVPENTSYLRFTLYNIAGLKIREEVLKESPAGFYSGKINIDGVSRGIYFIRMEVAGSKFIQTKKFLLI